MKPLWCLVVLAIQGLTVPLVILSFKWIEIRFFASSLASGLFLTSSAVVIYICARFHRSVRMSPVFWSTVVFLVCFVLPLFIGRMVYPPSVELSEMTILGVPGPILHLWSSKYYKLLVFCTIVETAMATYLWWGQKKRRA